MGRTFQVYLLTARRENTEINQAAFGSTLNTLNEKRITPYVIYGEAIGSYIYSVLMATFGGRLNLIQRQPLTNYLDDIADTVCNALPELTLIPNPGSLDLCVKYEDYFPKMLFLY